MAQADEVGQLWNQLRQKDATILMLQKKLDHFRHWLASVNSRVQQMNPSAVRNARKLYVGGESQGTRIPRHPRPRHQPDRHLGR
jgi:hypothetical protein